MKLLPYNVKVTVYCQNDDEAFRVQKAIKEIVSGTELKAPELLQFHAKYKQNEEVLKPILMDVFKNGIISISKHIPKLLKIR